MFLKIILSLFVIASAGGANASAMYTPQFISCGQFLYVNSIRINMDLKTMSYNVILQEPRDGGPDKTLGRGIIAKNLILKQGDYLNFELYENSKYVGFVKATDQNPQARKSYFYYKGQILGGEFPAQTFLCSYK